MEIENETKLTAGDIRVGDLFRTTKFFTTRVLMRTDGYGMSDPLETDHTVTAVSLGAGELNRFRPGTEVVRVQAKLIIE